MYYSTKGNSWSNKYLTPINRRKDQFGYRPDLDECMFIELFVY